MGPLSVGVSAHPLRLALIPPMLLATYLCPTSTDPLPWLFYGVILVIFALRGIGHVVAKVAVQGFFNRISDPAIGGTYLTVLNTINNVGNMVGTSGAFYLVDWLSCKEESCTYKRDGFYMAAILLTIFGALWLHFARPFMRKVELMEED